ncbi:DNA-binding protein [Zhongshania aliphaticivorans]|uniref:DNA-binding protein n=2 Tax=Zhongshania aliphaticivorans TaxID=1470434 RepID=A0A5S9N8N2_9GAMM|nr:DNA-binding protein [Zhongshania aliphaticivorans]CAA0086361.1 DNA-binding protein [Zhongshania aliphaticivorans]
MIAMNTKPPSNAENNAGAKDPLHGVTLAMIMTELEASLGWEELGRRIKIKCFTDNPSVASSLKFLRRTPWARQKVEALYIRHQRASRKV